MEQRQIALAAAFETAMVDAINIFVREALKPGGYLLPEKAGEIV
jgi:hypothetical protein